MLDFQSPDIFRAALESLRTAVCIVDRERKIGFWNEGAEKITGYLRQEVLGRFCGEILLVKFHANRAAVCEHSCPLVETMRDGRARESRVYLHHKSGYAVPVSLYTFPIRDVQGHVVGAVESFVKSPSVSTRGHPGSDLAVGHGLDEVTQLPDYSFTETYLVYRLKFASANAVRFGLLCVQLDHLDKLTSTHGQEAGEALLNVVAHTLRNGLNPLDFVGRWSEDQFLAVVEKGDNGALLTTAQRLTRLAQSSEVAWWGDPLSATVSVGGTVLRPGESIESLLGRTGNALQQAIAQGGNCAMVLDAPDTSQVEER